MAISLLLAGDIIIDRPDPRSIFKHVEPLMQAADITFVQAEQEFSDLGYPVAKWSVYSDPRIPRGLREAGVDVVSMAGNHAVDWGEQSLLDSLERLRAEQLVPVGAGTDKQAASEPVIVERNGVRVGFTSFCCVGPNEYTAGPRKPGFAGVRVWTHYEQFDVQPGTPPLIRTFCDRSDLKLVSDTINRLHEASDFVVAAFHWGIHYVSGLAAGIIPDYEMELGHSAIDSGADVVIGTHPHIIRGIEMYQGKPVFHSLGNFAVEVPTEEQHLWEGRLHVEYGRQMIDKLNQHRGGLWDLLFRYFGVTPEGGLLDYPMPMYPMPPEARRPMLAQIEIDPQNGVSLFVVPIWITESREPQPITRQSPGWDEAVDYIRRVTAAQGFSARLVEDGDRLRIEAGP
jgi:poly-gamma-glutamate synthesis protein (capsule biosynthesis protein)